MLCTNFSNYLSKCHVAGSPSLVGDLERLSQLRFRLSTDPPPTKSMGDLDDVVSGPAD